MVKGITRVDEARRAVEAGATAISESNHGGNNLDTTPATIRLLPAIADAVGGDVEVLGQAGVENVLDILRSGIDSALMGLCCSSVRDLTREDILILDSFARMLGASGVARHA